MSNSCDYIEKHVKAIKEANPRACAYCGEETVTKPMKALCDKCSALADEIIDSGKDRNWTEYQQQVDRRSFGD